MAEIQEVLIGNNSNHVARREAQLAKEEAELAELEKQAMEQTAGKIETEEEVVVKKEDSPKEETPKAKEAPKESEVDPEEETFKKRYSDLRRGSQKQIQEKDEEIKKLKAELEAKDKVYAASDDEIASWKKEYPDTSGVIEAMATKIAEEQLEVYREEIIELKGKLGENDKDKGMQSILTAHPDFKDLEESSEFQKWAVSQPEWMQDKLFSDNDPDGVIKVLNIYKLEKGSSKATIEKEVDLAAAAAVDTKSSSEPNTEVKGVIYESQVEAMSLADFEKNSDKIEEAMANGTFVYDLTSPHK